MGFTEREIGRMTLRKFLKLYGHYKNNFDLEMKMKQQGITYKQAEILSEQQSGDAEWFK